MNRLWLPSGVYTCIDICRVETCKYGTPVIDGSQPHSPIKITPDSSYVYIYVYIGSIATFSDNPSYHIVGNVSHYILIHIPISWLIFYIHYPNNLVLIQSHIAMEYLFTVAAPYHINIVAPL